MLFFLFLVQNFFNFQYPLSTCNCIHTLQVVLLLGACPFPERLDLQWFSTTLAALGSRFHAHAVRAALCIPSPEARTVSLLMAIEEGGVPVIVALEELRPAMAGGGVEEGSEATLANQVGGVCWLRVGVACLL